MRQTMAVEPEMKQVVRQTILVERSQPVAVATPTIRAKRLARAGQVQLKMELGRMPMMALERQTLRAEWRLEGPVPTKLVQLEERAKSTRTHRGSALLLKTKREPFQSRRLTMKPGPVLVLALEAALQMPSWQVPVLVQVELGPVDLLKGPGMVEELGLERMGPK